MPLSARLGRSGASSLTRLTNLVDSTNFTAMVWARITTLASWMGFIQIDGTTNYYQVGPNGDGSTFNIQESGVGEPGSTLVAGRWYHVALTSSASTGATTLAYLNGVLNITANSVAFTTAKMWFGNTSGGDPLDGNLAAIKVWNRVLSAGEIVQEMHYAMPVSWDALNSAYPMGNEWDIANAGLVIPRGALTRWADVSGINSELTEAGVIDTDNGPPILFASPRNIRARYFVPADAGPAAVTTRAPFLQSVPMRPGPMGLNTRSKVWAQATSDAITAPSPIITADSPRPFQMNIPMRPTAGGLVLGTPFQQARGTPVPPASPGSRRRIRLIT